MDLTNFSDVVEGLMKVSPPVLLSLGLNFILMYIGKIPKIKDEKDWLLPLIALGLGGLLYPFVAEIGKVSYTVKYPVMLNIIFGICIGGLSVATNKMFKELMRKLFGVPTGDTVIMDKQ